MDDVKIVIALNVLAAALAVTRELLGLIRDVRGKREKKLNAGGESPTPYGDKFSISFINRIWN